MSVAPGARLGPYEILSALGAGGMGEVYRARDTKLGRDVALKILPDSFTHDSERIARFRREAHVLAALNHPNIGAIYGLDDATGQQFLVLELVDGESLDRRIARGPIPVDEALPIAKQIAEAFEAAHEQGIIHRDLKPANIALTRDGHVKVLDFGLAKAIEPVSATSVDLANSPTITSPAMMTGVGMILGTAAYMSPEQAKGRAADKRSDMWAFGCVLYEMLTGKRAFAGEDVSDTLAFVITKEPDWAALPPITPPIRTLLRRCLEKDRRRRLDSAADARLEIDEALTAPTDNADLVRVITPRAAWRRAIPWAAAAVAMALAVFALITSSRRETSADQTVTRFELNLPTGVELLSTNTVPVAISADGRAVAFVGNLAAVRQVYLRRLEEPEARPLVRANDLVVTSVFFSPDGRSLGMVSTDGGVKTLSLKDGRVTTVAPGADYSSGATWTADNQIVYIKDATLWQVPASGGTPKQLTTLDHAQHDVAHRWPVALPGNQAILFSSYLAGVVDAGRLEGVSLPAGRRRLIADRGVPVAYTSTGHLIVFRDGALLAAPFDLTRLELTGELVRLTDGVADSGTGAPEAAISRTGSLVYASAGATMARLVSVTRVGAEHSLSDTPGDYGMPRLSPDGRRIVVAKSTEGLWLFDLARGVSTRLTVGDSNARYPVWTPDSQRVLFQTASGLRWIAVDGSGRGDAIPGTSIQDFPCSVSPDETLAFVRISPDTAGDIYTLSLRGDPTPRPLVKTPAYEGDPQFSPDGRWLAYASNESGPMQVYVRPYPGLAEKWPVSTHGGTMARWSHNGHELFYLDGNKMMVVDVSLSTSTSSLTLSQPRVLFEQRYAFGGSVTIPNYDLSPDGQGFVMIKEAPSANRLNVVVNWQEELKRLIPTR